MAPLHALLKDKQIQWTEEAEKAFEESKKMVAERTMLAFPAKTAFLSLAVDASDTAVGAVLQQRATTNQPWTPLGFYSHGLDATQRKYSAFDRELLAIKLAIEHFRFMLEGRSFTVFTDHKPLTTAILSSTERTPRQFRHLDFISQFTPTSNTSREQKMSWLTRFLASTTWRPLSRQTPSGRCRNWLTSRRRTRS